MATYLFENIQDIKKHIGGGANISIHFEDIDPQILTAAEKHLVPWLGDEFWNELSNAYPNNEEVLQKLYPFLQRSLAHLAMYEYLPLGRVMFTGNGLMRIELDNQKTAYKYQENEYARAMLYTGYDALEKALKFLTKHRGDYDTYNKSEEADRCSEGLLNWASQFQLAYGKGINRYTFETLLPQLRDVEMMVLLPLLGKVLFEKLRLTEQPEGTTKQLLKLIRKAIANATMREALSRNLVQLRGTNVVVPEKLEPQSSEKEASPTNAPLSIALRHEEEWAKRHLHSVRQFLLDHTDDFPDWEDAHQEAPAPDSVEVEPARIIKSNPDKPNSVISL